MNYAAGLVALGVIAVLYVVYRVAQKVFAGLFIVMCVHAYLLLVDRVYPDVSLLRIVHGSPCWCSNQTSSLPIHIEPPIITLTEISEKITEQVPSEWKSWIPSFLSTLTTTHNTDTPPLAEENESKPKPRGKANVNAKDEFEEFQRWKASQKKEL